MVRALTTPSVPRDVVLGRSIQHRDRELGLLVVDRLAGPGSAPPETANALDAMLDDDVRHAVRILGAIAAIEAESDGHAGPDGASLPLQRALVDELALIRERIVAGRVARHGRERLGPAIVGLSAGASNAALAVEALEVAVGTTESRVVVPLLDPSLTPAQRLANLTRSGRAAAPRRDAEDSLRDLVEDADDGWRSAWLRACAIHAAGARGVLGRIDLSGARALRDPVVDEELGGSAQRHADSGSPAG